MSSIKFAVEGILFLISFIKFEIERILLFGRGNRIPSSTNFMSDIKNRICKKMPFFPHIYKDFIRFSAAVSSLSYAKVHIELMRCPHILQLSPSLLLCLSWKSIFLVGSSTRNIWYTSSPSWPLKFRLSKNPNSASNNHFNTTKNVKKQD
jgi:hypothetical protein